MVSLLTLLTVLCVSLPNISYAAETNTLQKYEQKLEEINEKLGTNYKIANEQELEESNTTYAEMLAFYDAMSEEEFENYIMELHNLNIQVDETNSLVEYNSSNNMSRSSSVEEQYFYYNSDNYIGIETYNIKIGGISYYQGVKSYYCTKNSYPCYNIIGFTGTPSSDSTQLTCTFKCNKYLSPTIIDGNVYNINNTFTAHGGGTLSAYSFSKTGTVSGSGIRLRNYPNTSSSVLEVMYSPETVYIDSNNSTMTFYCVKRQSTGTIGYASKDYISSTVIVSE